MLKTNDLMCRFLFFLIWIAIPVNAQKINVNIQSDAAYFTENKDSILSYQIAEKSLNGRYSRCNYIHPLFGLDGQVLTEDFPEDHLHHRGVFWAWHQLYIGDKQMGDSWELKDFSYTIASVKEIKDGGNAKGIQTEVFWKSNLWVDAKGAEKAMVKEVTTIKVYPADKTFRQIDISISLLALEPNMRIGGSENIKGYGGFSTRMRLPEAIVFMGSSGQLKPQKTPVQSDYWMDFSGAMGINGTQGGLSILCHPENPSPSNQWILRAKNSMQNAVYPFPGATPVPLSQTTPTLLRYRLIVHNGHFNRDALKSNYTAYSRTNP